MIDQLYSYLRSPVTICTLLFGRLSHNETTQLWIYASCMRHERKIVVLPYRGTRHCNCNELEKLLGLANLYGLLSQNKLLAYVNMYFGSDITCPAVYTLIVTVAMPGFLIQHGLYCRLSSTLQGTHTCGLRTYLWASSFRFPIIHADLTVEHDQKRSEHNHRLVVGEEGEEDDDHRVSAQRIRGVELTPPAP